MQKREERSSLVPDSEQSAGGGQHAEEGGPPVHPPTVGACRADMYTGAGGADKGASFFLDPRFVRHLSRSQAPSVSSGSVSLDLTGTPPSQGLHAALRSVHRLRYAPDQGRAGGRRLGGNAAGPGERHGLRPTAACS